MPNETDLQAPLERLIEDDAIGQLRRRDGRMATLGSENGVLKLDWVEAVARLLANPARIEMVEAEARAIRARGIRHIIWAGMGGSVLTVRVLCELGFCHQPDDERQGVSPATERQEGAIAIYPLDSTDSAALNAIIRALAAAKHLTLPPATAPDDGQAEAAHTPSPQFLHALLGDVMMVGVAMGMTSEEPITHLEWFTALLTQAGLPPAEHLLVMTLPGSYLDNFAHGHHAPSLPLQVDGGTGTGGRMSAPGTRVFLLPAALYLTGLADEPGQLASVLRRAWDEYDLDLAAMNPAAHPFVRLAAALSAAGSHGACRLLVRLPAGWHALVAWLEQLMEESLGKGGKGIVVFDDQTLNTAAPYYHPEGLLRVHVVSAPTPPTTTPPPTDERVFTLAQPSLAAADPRDRLAALAASFLGWQLSMALYGYLQGIPFAGQPAVENYKARARALRAQPDPLHITAQWEPALRAESMTLLAPTGTLPPAAHASLADLATALATILREGTPSAHGAAPSRADAHRALDYLDVTINGVAPTSLSTTLDERVRALGNMLLGVPVKSRTAPAAYHSTEQGEMDGPPNLISLRLVARETEASLLGSYSNQFLHAQAVSTWQAMMEAGRACFLLVVDGTFDTARERLVTLFSRIERDLAQP